MLLGAMRLFFRSMSKTPKGNFTSKRGNKNFYKGRGGRKYGIPSPKGGFISRGRPDWQMPSLEGFGVRRLTTPSGPLALSTAPCVRAPQLKPYVWPGEGLSRRRARLDASSARADDAT